ncbi:tRNA adenosine(34) deaminase TadA [Rhodohalobacter mucosus]|nr:tRNA adenosine(34) deaminase TadA [Rhodohalobacter mucosus]
MDKKFMIEAFKLAERAYMEKEIPVGAVVVHQNRIIGKGYNQVERLKDPTAHAEMIAISAACAALENKYLEGCTLYVTLEPCPMCAGAMVWAKLDRVVFGAMDEKAGACGTRFNIASSAHLNHRLEVIQGVMEADSGYLLKQFFEERR